MAFQSTPRNPARRITTLALIAAAAAVAPAAQASAAVYMNGYGAFVGQSAGGRFNTDNADIGGLGFFDNNQTMKLSDNRPSIANSTWTATPIEVGSVWTASWTYTLPGDTGSFDRADGFTFGYQNDPRGTAALGGQGGLLGYGAGNGRTAVTPSVVAMTNLYGTRRNQIQTNGTTGATNTATIGFVLNNGVPKNYTVSYANGVLRQTITDTATGAISSYQRSIDIPATVGGPTAYLGFTASSGGNGADQTLTNFKFASNQTFSPIAISTGYNTDFVVDANAPVGDVSSTVNATMDGGKVRNATTNQLTGATFFARGYAGTTTTGLPMGSTFTSAASPLRTYALAPDAGNNAIVLDNSAAENTTGTLTFATPKAYTQLSILASSGNGTNTFDMFVHYSDGNSEFINANAALDWYNNGIVALAAQQRVSNIYTGALDPAVTPNAVYPALYSTDVFLSNTTSLVSSIDFYWKAGTGHTAIFAISGASNAPASIAGDYNRDGYVDAADYTVWADSFGQTGTGLAADGNSDSVVDAADYTIWADNFGRGTPPASLTGAVPEPTALAFAAPALALLARRRR